MTVVYTRNRAAGRRRIIRWVVTLSAAGVLLFSLTEFLSYRARVRHNQSGESIHALTTDILQYAQDHGGTLPPMKDWTTLKGAVWPYAKSDAAFRSYDDNTHVFLPNPNLSQKKLSAVNKLTVLLYESEPSKADNSRWIAFLLENALPSAFGGDPDFIGLKLVKEAEWQKLKAAKGIP